MQVYSTYSALNKGAAKPQLLTAGGPCSMLRIAVAAYVARMENDVSFRAPCCNKDICLWFDSFAITHLMLYSDRCALPRDLVLLRS